MKKSVKRVMLFVMSVALMLVSSLSVLSGDASALVDTDAKDFLYAMAMYDCIAEYGDHLVDNIEIGNNQNNRKISSLLGDYGSMKVYIGKWLGDEDGMIRCDNAMENALTRKTKVTNKQQIESGLLKGVYEVQTETLKKMRIRYFIVNSNESGWQTNQSGGDDFYWPQGFYKINGEPKGHLDFPPFYIYYNENGYIKHTGGPSNVSVDQDAVTSKLTVFCNSVENCEKPSNLQAIVGNTPVIFDSDGQSIPVMSSTVKDPFSWLTGDDSCKAITYKDNIQAITETEVNTTNVGKKTDNAKEQMLINIRGEFFDYLYVPEQYINTNAKMPAIKYLIMGRYLFNGDGKFGGGCGGIAVLENDANISKIDPISWDPSLDYIASGINIYGENYGFRQRVRIKLGGDSGKTEGEVRDVRVYPFTNSGTEISCKELATEFSNITFNNDMAIKKEVYGYAGIIKIDSETGDVEVPDEVVESSMDCWNAGIEGQAWILCPTETNLTGFVRIASNLIDDMLAVNSDLYNDESATHAVWNIMVGAANTLMAIVLLVIIFSQLTGYGIDNYGIKKMLPKLIMVAVLLNLSFFLCEIAVDLSNIAGNGLKELFYGIGGSIIDTEELWKMDNFLDYVIPTIYGLLMAGAPIGGGIVLLISSGGGALVVFLIILSLLGVVAAVVTFIAMLGARMIIVIVCISLAPLAIACYVLPNTQSMYKKWWKALQTALIMYPLCGVVLGISYVIKAMVISAGTDAHLIMYFVAIIAPFLPFFMLPTLLKGALSTLGTVGSALTSMGNTFRNSVKGTADVVSRGIRESERFKAGQQMHSANQQYRRDAIMAKRAENTRKSLEGKRAKGPLNAKQQDRLKRAQDILAAQSKREQDNAAQTQAGYYESVLAKQGLDTSEAAQDMMQYGNPYYIEAQQIKGANARTERKAEAYGGVLPVNEELAYSRARSRRQAQELKAYSDQFSTLTRADMATQLNEAAVAYNSDRNETNALRLQAALTAAESRKMNKEMLNSIGGLSLNAKDENDSKILNQLSTSSNKALSQYGKQVSKTSADTLKDADGHEILDASGNPISTAANMSLNEFITGTGKNVNGDIATGINMQKAFSNQGNNVLNNMDDDTLFYINQKADTSLPSIITPDQLINAAIATTNEKELTQINAMVSKLEPASIKLSGSQLVNAHPSFINELLKDVDKGGKFRNNADFKNMMTLAYNSVMKDPNLSAKMDPTVMDKVKHYVNPVIVS